MKKILLIVVAVLGIGGVIAYLNRLELMLMAISMASDQRLADLGEPRDVPWSQGPSVASGDDDRPPNIVLIVADDLGYNDISTFGGGVDGRLKTPSIDRLAAEGAVFQQSYSGHSTCAPSRAMMMTGRYSARTGFAFTPTPPGMLKTVSSIGNATRGQMPPAIYDEASEALQPDYSSKGLPSSEVTIAELLQESGYYTAHVGKWHLGRGPGMAPNDQGFDDSLIMQSGLYLPKDDPNVVNAFVEFDPIDRFLWSALRFAGNFNSATDEGAFKPKGYLTDYWTDESIKVIKANKHRPFFLFLAHWGPHTPLQATREDYEAVGDIKPHRKRVYAGMVRAVDRSVGRILDTLEAEGLSDNTIVMFTSDNGGAGYIGLPDVNEPFRGWKITFFEGGIRVPLFIKWPGQIEPGTVVNEPVAHIDVMPTIASVAGATLPSDVVIDGVDLMPTLTGVSDEALQDRPLFWEADHNQIVRFQDWKLQINDRPTDGLKRWLFDLSVDPTEQINLVDARPDKAAELQALLDNHRANARPPLYPPILNGPTMVDKALHQPFEPGDEYVYVPN